MEVTVPFVHADNVDCHIGVGHLHLAGIDGALFGAVRGNVAQ
jgi:hypothetical protein